MYINKNKEQFRAIKILPFFFFKTLLVETELHPHQNPWENLWNPLPLGQPLPARIQVGASGGREVPTPVGLTQGLQWLSGGDYLSSKSF